MRSETVHVALLLGAAFFVWLRVVELALQATLALVRRKGYLFGVLAMQGVGSIGSVCLSSVGYVRGV